MIILTDIIQGNIPVSVAAKVLRVDPQTVRLLLQNKLVPWGLAFKRSGSKKYSYLIFAKPFYEATGYKFEESRGI